MIVADSHSVTHGQLDPAESHNMCRPTSSVRFRKAHFELRIGHSSSFHIILVTLLVLAEIQNGVWSKCAINADVISETYSNANAPTVSFPEICKGLLFRSILRMYIQNLKFVALSVPEIIGVLKKFGQSLDTPTLHFLSNF